MQINDPKNENNMILKIMTNLGVTSDKNSIFKDIIQIGWGEVKPI